MNQKTLSLLSFALGLIVMRWLSQARATDEIDLVTRLRHAGAL